MTAGRRSIDALKTTRAASYPSSPGPRTSPASERRSAPRLSFTRAMCRYDRGSTDNSSAPEPGSGSGHGGVALEPVAHPAQADDPMLAELASQVADVDVDDVRAAGRTRSPRRGRGAAPGSEPGPGGGRTPPPSRTRARSGRSPCRRRSTCFVLKSSRTSPTRIEVGSSCARPAAAGARGRGAPGTGTAS